MYALAFATVTTAQQFPAWVYPSIVSIGIAIAGWLLASSNKTNKDTREYVKEQNELQNKQIDRLEKKIDENDKKFDEKLFQQKEEFRKDFTRLENKLDNKASSDEVTRIYDLVKGQDQKLNMILSGKQNE